MLRRQQRRIATASIHYLCVVLTLEILFSTFCSAWFPKLCVSNSNRCVSRPSFFSSISGTQHDDECQTHQSPLSLTLEELADTLGGKGRAQAVWDAYRTGLDPIDVYHPCKDQSSKGNETRDPLLGKQAYQILKKHFGRINETVASLVQRTTAKDGTTKLLIKLLQDGMEVETVIIPWNDRKKSTLCVSSQVGCRQACTFCLTGKMGLLRSLTADEILAQVFVANAVCRQDEIYPIDNIVFMGMGEPADNVGAVVRAAHALTHDQQFQLAPRRVTVSTVAPSPDAFAALGEAPVVLAWSIHASREELRRTLVPTTQYSMKELREGLIQALNNRSRRMRATMLEVTLLDNINDSTEDAIHLADFCQPIFDRVLRCKLVINLIPWNDISASFGPASLYRTPTPERVAAFQKALVDRSILCYVRTTRGDDESAACGQLATKKRTGIRETTAAE